jgi:hypothetical protein
VWTPETLLTTFRAREARFPYYEFESVDFTRYPGPDGAPVPVAISVREIDPSGIGDDAWQNLHLRDLYIRGMGAVASAAAERTADWGPPMHLYAIPPEFAGGASAPQGLRLTRPSVYFGSRSSSDEQQYVIVSAGVGALATEEGAGVPGVDFPEGILLDSPFKKLTLAWRFRDPNLLFTSQVTDSSRMVFRRSVAARAEEIAPFFRYLDSPYPVVADGRIVWILEGFTTSRQFPLSRPLPIDVRESISYVRNSVKVTVDAVTGETRFYALPGEDPLRDAYAQAFPGLLRPIDEMPESLRQHLRYSKMLIAIQGAVLLEYHQDTARRFHERQDVWAVPEELLQTTNPVPYRPEYGIYRLPEEEEPTFNLTTAFVPSGRQNLTAVVVGRLDDVGDPELILFDLPVEDQAPGPHQVEALVEQQPAIAQQFSLWRSGGSQVWTGHLHVVPVGSQLFYMEPVFLAATDNAIPELQRFVVSDGRRVSMEPTLQAAIEALSGERLPSGLDPSQESPDSPTGLPDVGATLGWPREALDLLELAEQRLREGDWAGFGVAFEELRRMLERYGGQGGASSGG